MRIVIVEDDREAKQRLEDCLHQYEAEYGVSFSIAWYANGFDFLEGWHHGPQLLWGVSDRPGRAVISAGLGALVLSVHGHLCLVYPAGGKCHRFCVFVSGGDEHFQLGAARSHSMCNGTGRVLVRHPEVSGRGVAAAGAEPGGTHLAGHVSGVLRAEQLR